MPPILGWYYIYDFMHNAYENKTLDLADLFVNCFSWL